MDIFLSFCLIIPNYESSHTEYRRTVPHAAPEHTNPTYDGLSHSLTFAQGNHNLHISVDNTFTL